jgi:chromosome segregation ATPase
MTSRDSLRFSEQSDQFRDRPVDSPEYREIKDTLHALESTLGRQLVQLRRCEKEGRDIELEQAKLISRKAEFESLQATASGQLRNDQSPPPRSSKRIEQELAELQTRCRKSANRMRTTAAKQEKLQTQIAGLETEIEPLERRLCEAVRKQSRLQMLIDGDYRLLDPRKKSMMDALRITASNMFRNVQEQFRAIYDNFRDDHVLVRLLSRCSGSMTRTSDTVVFRCGSQEPCSHTVFTLSMLCLKGSRNRQTADSLAADRSA